MPLIRGPYLSPRGASSRRVPRGLAAGSLRYRMKANGKDEVDGTFRGREVHEGG